MKLSRVVLSVLLSACSLLSFSCGPSGKQCQSTYIDTDGGSSPVCAKTGESVQACCTGSQCKYVVGASDAGTGGQDFPCDGTNCLTATQRVRDYCALP
jgi:hypothetical protein